MIIRFYPGKSYCYLPYVTGWQIRTFIFFLKQPDFYQLFEKSNLFNHLIITE